MQLYAALPGLVAVHAFSDSIDTPIVRAAYGDSSGVQAYRAIIEITGYPAALNEIAPADASGGPGQGQALRAARYGHRDWLR